MVANSFRRIALAQGLLPEPPERPAAAAERPPEPPPSPQADPPQDRGNRA